ncbi:very short patch repair endonuclease [Pleionea mediterranea]|uniref:Very short patch repair endonuclease n=1 Tax=Pleionea mediterranea TaxID=523701 RepID=A0A316G0M9_9GAMM|nr:very short patch repair endonuclease [Pleionea mediterranea]PWK47907.1 T/G mismatch-specific endonuclease [Pleionea mediterranea]
MDIVSKKKRSELMSDIKSYNTKPEIMVRKVLYNMGFRYRINDSVEGIKPDIILRKYNVVIFVHGCYWHRHRGCLLAYNPKSKVDFWNQKFKKNIERDKKVFLKLKLQGWRVGVIWECTTRNSDEFARTMLELQQWILNGSDEFESTFVKI